MSITCTLPGVLLAGRDPETGLGGMERHGRVGPDRLGPDLAGRAVDPARDVAGDHRDARRACAGGVDRGDRAADRLARRAGEAGPEQRVDDPGCPSKGSRRELSPIAAHVDHARLAPHAPATRARPRRPSPPLLPLPQTIANRPSGTSSAHTRARPEPARSISVSARDPVLLDRPVVEATLLRSVRQRLSARLAGPSATCRRHSTVTVLARLRGWSTLSPRRRRDEVRQQLQRHDRQQWVQHPVRARHADHLVAVLADLEVALGRDADHAGAARANLLDVGDHLLEHRRVGRDRHDRRASRPAARSGRASSRRPRRRRSRRRRSP